MYKIEKGIPLPRKDYGKTKSALMGALSMMELGDSFIVEGTSKRSMVGTYASRLRPKEFATRSLDKNPDPRLRKFRVWRVA